MREMSSNAIEPFTASRTNALRSHQARFNWRYSVPGFAPKSREIKRELRHSRFRGIGVQVLLISRRGKVCRSSRIPTWASRRCTVCLAR